MIIFTIVGLVVSLVAILVFIYLIHLLLYKIRAYRILVDWVVIPYFIFFYIPRMQDNSEDMSKVIKAYKGHKNIKSVRFKIGLWAMNKRLDKLKSIENLKTKN